MITRIASLESFGPFAKFEWPTGLSDFLPRNVLFGWNATGKTSVSRLVACLEHRAIFPQDDYFRNAHFCIETDGGGSVTENTLASSPPVRVYNEDFVKRQFSFTEDQRLSVINIVIGESSKEDIARFEDAKTSFEACTKEHNTSGDQFAQANTAKETFLTEKAASVRKAIGVTGNVFNTTKLDAELTALSSETAYVQLATDEHDLLMKEKQVQGKSTLAKKLKLPWPDIAACKVFAISVQTCLAKEIVKQVIEDVSSDGEMNAWLQEGLRLHKDRRSCEFCGGKLTEDRLAKLRQRFSTEYQDLQGLLAQSGKAVDEAAAVIQTTAYDRHIFDDTLIGSYDNAENSYLKASAALKQELATLKDSLTKKLANPFDAVALDTEGVEGCSVELEKSVSQIHSLVDQHNALQADISGRRENALRKLSRDEAARYVSDYQRLTRTIDEASEKSTAAAASMARAREVLDKARAKVVQPAKGAERVNHYLRHLLCSDSISLVHSDDGTGYRLVRGERAASHLSEGERTAITFAYFIATLEDEAVDLSKTVVVIDDPVSSLDSNKVHATYGLIADKLWQKSNQLFVLSHHFQFIKLFHGPKQDKIAWYSMQGTSSGQPSIAACPDLITDFQSEYYYLFYRLHHLVPDDSNFYISRNILRRFLEALLEFKFGRGDFRSKLEQWFQDSQLTAEMYGVLNAGSHPNDVDDFSDPRRFREMVYRVCRSIRDRDPDHHTALIRHLNRDVGKCKPPADGTVCALCALLSEKGAAS